MEKKDMTAVITRCLNGDSLAQEELVLAVQNRVYYHCKKMLKDEDRALDLTQDVLLAMLTKLDTLQNPESFWSWVGGITANLCRNAVNRGPREVQIPEDEEGNSLLDTYETLDEQTVPDKALDNDETRRMIAELVDDLPDAQRQCVLLYYYDEMSVKDIAASLDVSENTIKSRLNYARKSIKEGVERYEKQGIKLYGLSPLPFLLFFLGRDAKACSMTAEQAAQLAQQVVQGTSAAAAGAGTVAAAANAAAGSSAASAVGGSAAATTAKAAATVAGKGLLGGLSTKIIAGVAAGLILAGGITGGVLLGGEKDTGNAGADTDQIPVSTQQASTDIAQSSRDDGLTPMEYVAFPEWVNKPYDQLADYFGEDCVASGTEFTLSDGSSYREYHYSKQDGTFLLSTRATMDDDRITMALSYGSGYFGWRDISLGETYQSVMTKLGLEEIPADHNRVGCYCYEDGASESEYFAQTADWPEHEVVFFYYATKGSDSWGQIELEFVNEKLENFIYHWRSPASSQSPSEEGDASPHSDRDSGEATGETPGTTQDSASSTTDDLSQDDILVDFQGELIELSNPFRVHSLIWTRTEDSYYAIAPNTVFTVANNGTNENVYLMINAAEYIRSAESFLSIVNHDGEYKELDMLGEYWFDDEGLRLSHQPTELSAGENLYWAKGESGSDQTQRVKLLPGESVTFHLPEREQDTIYSLVVRYYNDAEDFDFSLPSRGFWVSADDVSAPSSANLTKDSVGLTNNTISLDDIINSSPSDGYVEPEREPAFISRPWPVDTFVDETLDATAEYLLSVLPDETFAYDLREFKAELTKITETGMRLYVRDDKDININGYINSANYFGLHTNAEAREFVANYVKNFDPSYLFADQFPAQPEDWSPYEIYYDQDYEKYPEDQKVAQENWELHLAIISFAATIEDTPMQWAVEWWQTGQISDAGLKNHFDSWIAGRGIYSNIKIVVE